jgi:hypothetical protein
MYVDLGSSLRVSGELAMSWAVDFGSRLVRGDK